MNLENELNSDQKAAVLRTEGPVLILAGAGSGKTRVITYRAAYLLSLGISPFSILAVTFTNKAAEEIRKRVLALAGGKANDLWLHTFHSFCARLLRIEARQFGMNPGYVIFDQEDSQRLIKNCLKALEMDEKVYRPSMMCETISRAKDNLLDSESYAIYAAETDEVFKRQAANLYLLYQSELNKMSALDFGDLIMTLVHSFETHPEILEKYRGRFEYVMVDEYQDTNRAQYVLVKKLVGKKKNICVVGDDDQSIYSWRGADVQNILSFEKDYPEAFVVHLGRNYRSTGKILKAASSVVRHNSKRMEKPLRTERQEGEEVSVLDFNSELDEASAIVSLIGRNKGSSRLSDFAIFYRMNAQSRVLEDALRRSGIPYRIYGNIRFYERREVKDILSYLSLVVNPSNAVALRRVINVPSRGIGKETLAKLDETAYRNKKTLFEVIRGIPSGDSDIMLGQKMKAGFSEFVKLIDEAGKLAMTGTASEVAKFLIQKSGYLDVLREEKTLESESRRENLEELVTAIKEFEISSPGSSLSEFLAQVSLMSPADEVQSDDYVTLMTLHLAKGLEFDTVFMTGLEDGIFPHMRSKLVSYDCEEERRLCYVGMTRAKNKLYMTYSSSRRIFGSQMFYRPSRFLSEAGFSDDEMDAFPSFSEKTVGKTGKEEMSFLRKQESIMDSRFHGNDRQCDAKMGQSSSDEDPNEYGLSAGDKVKHIHFGEGKIISLENAGPDSRAEVLFADGRKKTLNLKYARLEKAQ